MSNIRWANIDQSEWYDEGVDGSSSRQCIVTNRVLQEEVDGVWRNIPEVHIDIEGAILYD